MPRRRRLFFKIMWSTIVDELRRRPVNKLQRPLSRPAEKPTVTPGSRPISSSASTPTSPLPPTTHLSTTTVVAPQPLHKITGISVLSPKREKRNIKKKWWPIGVVAAIALIIGGLLLWYTVELSPVDRSTTNKKLVKVELGTTPTQIARLLRGQGLIRNETVFLWQARFKGVQNTLQAGTYRLSPSESTPEIIDHIAKGKIDTFTLTFLPGATLKADRDMLISAGYSADEVDAALAKTYDSPLFAGKPAGTDLEGYIYGELYAFATDTSAEAVLQRVFDEYYSVVRKNDLEAKYAAHGLSLYQGITLASIIQREARPKGDDMAGIAEVFYNRLNSSMPLGSDATYQYIADKTGVTRNPNLDSPYNTRRYTGLPPGPIATPGEKALIAGASPAVGNYLFFLNGDDGVTYFARTLDEHNANIKNHCQEKCKIL